MKLIFLSSTIFLLKILISNIGFAQLSVVPFVSNVNRVTDISNCGDDRLFITEQRGVIKISDLDGNLNSVPFLSIVNRVRSTGNEQGLLGVAFSPNYKTDGRFYVNYINQSSSTVISRFTVLPGNHDVADSLNEEILLTIQQPYTNHNGGAMHFGKDGYLYIASGDGGSGGDPGDRAQNLQSLLGKMLRIDVSGSSGYTIPESNPFFNNPNADPHIWSYGLRNPWRFSFDRLTGDMWMGDVGQNAWEEINFESANNPGGDNYGWRCYEANMNFNLTGCLAPSEYVFPVFDIPHGPDCSVTGGYVYRGGLSNNLFGKYLFTDYCSGRIWGLYPNDSSSFADTLYGAFGSLVYTTFGQDRYGELYLGKNTSGVVKLIDSTCTPVAYISSADTIFHPSHSYVLSTPYHPQLTYQWYFNDAPLTSGNRHIFLAHKPGEYRVYVQKNDSCFNSSKKVVLVLGQNESFELYPNPAVDFVDVVWSLNFQGRKTLEVIDISGRLVLRENINIQALSYSLNTSQLAHGIYIIRMTHNDNSYSQKLMVR